MEFDTDTLVWSISATALHAKYAGGPVLMIDAVEQDILTAFSKLHSAHAADRCIKWLYRRPLAVKEPRYPGFKYYGASKMPPPINGHSRIPAT